MVTSSNPSASVACGAIYALFPYCEALPHAIRKALYLQNKYSVELLLVPNTEEVSEEAEVMLNSADITKFITDRTELVDVTDLPTIEDAINNQNKNDENNQ